MYTLVETAKENDMEPWTCLNYLFERGETEQSIQLGRDKLV